jgi:hypothetical protein
MKTLKEQQFEDKGFLDGLSVLESVLDKLNDEDNSYNMENAYEDLRDYRNSILCN